MRTKLTNLLCYRRHAYLFHLVKNLVNVLTPAAQAYCQHQRGAVVWLQHNTLLVERTV